MMSNDEPGGTRRSHEQFLKFVRTYAGLSVPGGMSHGFNH